MPVTPWAVICPVHGKVHLTEGQYDFQLSRPDDLWTCPRCGRNAEWDDENYDKFDYIPTTEEES